ncbi:MAG: hypothetical protein IKZ76_08730 [Lachnospiraceae bacterium]|nr:hypothetical protein [Lachnospiraceae bacterium]
MKRDGRFALLIFVVAIICFLGFSYFNSKSELFKKEAIDISSMDGKKLEPGMHVKINANKCLGYYLSSKRDKSRYYLVLSYNKKRKEYDRVIDVKVEPKDFEQWGKLFEDTRNNNGTTTPIYIDGYTVGMDSEHYKYYLSAIGKTGLTMNYATNNYSVVSINKKQINMYKFLTFSGGIVFIILGLLYLNWLYQPFNRSIDFEEDTYIKPEVYDVEINEEEFIKKEKNDEE